MIHMSQVKVPVKELVKKAEPELFCKGKIGRRTCQEGGCKADQNADRRDYFFLY